jgi:hypothetical protein
MKLEAETKLKVLEMETKRTDAERRAKDAERIRQEKQAQADLARQESERVRQQKLAEESVKKEAEDRINKAKQSFVNGGFKLLDKNQFREVHYKLLPVKWINGAKVISVDALVNRNELTFATNTGLKWFSERVTIEVNCVSGSMQVASSVITDGPWITGEVLRSNVYTRPYDLTNPHEWHKSLGLKFCDA